MSEVRSKNADVLTAIRDEKELSAATDAKLKGIMEQFLKHFA